MTNLLLIDDDEVDRKMVLRLLQGITPPVEIVQAATAQDGLKIFEDGRFDAVLLDYLLPDMTGLDALPILVRHPTTRTAVIVLTGATDEALALQCLKAGAQDVLLKKEVNAKHLQRAIIHARARHALEKKLAESHEKYKLLAETDQLTGLPNRHFFDEILVAGVEQRRNKILALLLLDLDHFKSVNDTLGHAVGDVLLRNVALRLRSITAENQTLCRIDGDEFAIIAPGLETDLAASEIAARTQAALLEPFLVHDTDFTVTCSIGVAVATDSAMTAEQLLTNADLAMYRAKRDGRNRAHIFTPALQLEAIRKAATEKELRGSTLFDQLRLFYQPLLDASSLQLCGAEALIRWQHPTRGLLPPSEFIDIAEEFGLMSRLDAWTRRAACQQLSHWRTSGLVEHTFRMSFNVSASTLNQPDLDLLIRDDCAAAGVPEASMELEVTEGVLVDNFERSAALLHRVKMSGVGIAIDDFGTGYSSMAYLKRLPASTLKIDRSFLFDVPDVEAYCRVLKSMIVMAKSLELHVIVEGVETGEQAKLCHEYGADLLQGYYFSKPVSAEEFEVRFFGNPCIEGAEPRVSDDAMTGTLIFPS